MPDGRRKKGIWNGLCRKHAKICRNHLTVSRLSFASDSKVENLFTCQVKARGYREDRIE